MTLSEKSCTLALFVASVVSSAWWPTMPDWRWLLLGIITTGSIIKLRRGLISIGAILGLMVVIIHGNVLEYQRQALFNVGENSTITGKVDSSFNQISHGYEGLVTIKQVGDQSLLPFLKPKVRFITTFPIPVNSEFTTTAQVKPIIGLRNEAGFDAEKQAMGSGILARMIVTGDAHWIIRNGSSVRQSIINLVMDDISHLDRFPLINALVFADRSWLSGDDWQGLRDSGLLHLVSISGLHIGMAFSFGFLLGVSVRSVIPRYQVLPAITGLTVALCYAWLADFSLPTTRAVSVCVIYIVLKYGLVHWSTWRVLLLAVAFQLLIQPFASFSMSFWLSYLSVGMVLLVINFVRFNNSSWRGKLRTLFVTQLALSVFVIPISGYFFSGFSLSSIAYNLVFIPWFGFVVVPLMFIALSTSLLLPAFSPIVWQLMDFALWPLSESLQYAFGTWQPLSIEFTWILFSLCTLLVLKRLLLWQGWLLLCVITIIVSGLNGRKSTSWRIDVLDVGHGLAVLVEKEGKALIYDTGKSWPEGSVAEQVIIPVLHRRGFREVDTLVLSHSDNDHAGGRFVIETQLNPTNKRSSQGFDGYMPCVSGDNWTWQQLDIEVLWPPQMVTRAYNPHSCVFKLIDRESDFSMLFTGDIESISEWILLREPEKLSSDVMLVPHHGSKSSSNPLFIHAVSPTLAVASLAKNNQWGMPADKVVTSYLNAGALWLDTGEGGQVTIRVTKDKWDFVTKRSDTFEPWYRQMLRKGLE
ncbi:DNA internalization-related competence protein ComEC/Rec2 [Vibrio natriegens]|uniref:DNA internalization-related competence protein ComEC/Rec2 n=1 Tax=Vibrio natriegens TaxID=691 RepID=UPI0021E76B5E|nr:DNA internalization-related competence protein ComEC/Rec2 [Vibrio natriegens]UYI48066.1 DNA internalization-related competence protein ComEC/Rec2 [Vibrio natriegens]